MNFLNERFFSFFRVWYFLANCAVLDRPVKSSVPDFVSIFAEIYELELVIQPMDIDRLRGSGPLLLCYIHRVVQTFAVPWVISSAVSGHRALSLPLFSFEHWRVLLMLVFAVKLIVHLAPGCPFEAFRLLSPLFLLASDNASLVAEHATLTKALGCVSSFMRSNLDHTWIMELFIHSFRNRMVSKILLSWMASWESGTI